NNPNGREFDLNCAISIVAVAEKQVFVRNVISDDVNVVWELSENPHALTISECARGVVYGGALANNGIKEPECFTVLQCCVGTSHNTQHRNLFLFPVIIANDCVSVENTIVFCLPSKERLFYNRPVQMCSFYRFFGRGRFLQDRPEAMPS